MQTLPKTKMQAIAALKSMSGFIGATQRSALADMCRSEEKQFFFDKLVEMADIIDHMPVTVSNGRAGQPSRGAVALLHRQRGLVHHRAGL